MNIFVTHGRILHKEPPKIEGRSGLVILKVGRDKGDANALVQSVNQVIVRIPPPMTERLEKFNVDDVVEVFGHIGGTMRRSPLDGSRHSGLELVARNIQPCKQVDPEDEDVEAKLYNRFVAIGLLRKVREPEKSKRPTTAMVQIGPERRDEGRDFQHAGTVSVAAYSRVAKSLGEISTGQAVHMEGRVIGLLRRVPHPTAEGGYESLLEAGLVLDRVQLTGFIAEKILQPAPERRREPDSERRPKEESDAPAS